MVTAHLDGVSIFSPDVPRSVTILMAEFKENFARPRAKTIYFVGPYGPSLECKCEDWTCPIHGQFGIVLRNLSNDLLQTTRHGGLEKLYFLPIHARPYRPPHVTRVALQY